MSERPGEKPGRWSLRRFLIFWSAGVIVTVCLLALMAIVTTTRLREMTERIHADAAATGTAGEFSRAILDQRRDDFLWHITRSLEYRDRSMQKLSAIEQRDFVNLLHTTSTSPEEGAMIEEIDHAYQAFHHVAQTAGHQTPKEVLPHADRLLVALERLRKINDHQMNVTRAASARLNATADRFSIMVIIVLPLMILVTTWRLWSRIFQPILGLSQATRAFGAGDLTAHAPILVDDEMGEVCRTFNMMAEEIAAREHERLDFLATVVHDLRNPLTVIGGTTNLLRRGEAAISDKRAAWYDRVLAQARRLEAMTFDLTNTVQVQTGRLILEMKLVDLATVIRTVAADQMCTDQGRHVILCEANEPCPVIGDEPRLERVFANLFSNAVKYSEEKTEIRATLMRRDGQAVVTITDQGFGIAPDDLRDLFKPFRRAGGVRGRVRGTGLGLFSVKRIIEAHEGRLAVHSRVNVGTTVEVTLPLKEENGAVLSPDSIPQR